MTEELFRDDATLLHCQATLTAVGEIGIELDRSVFYPLGGGQAGDSGWLRHPLAVRAGAASGGRLLDHRRLCPNGTYFAARACP